MTVALCAGFQMVSLLSNNVIKKWKSCNGKIIMALLQLVLCLILL